MKIDISELGKVNRVIQSCETLAHYETADRYCGLYVKKLFRNCDSSNVKSVGNIMSEIFKDLSKKKTEIQNEEMSLR